MMFLVWYDADPARPLAEKVQGALGAYSKRFNAPADLVLVNEVDQVAVTGIEVRSARTVQKNHFWAGLADVTATQLAEKRDGSTD